MEIVKKNLVSILCGALVLLAIIALFWPLGGMLSDLQGKGQQRYSIYTSLDALRNRPRTLPNLDPNNTGPKPLKPFPTKPVIEKAREVTKSVSRQATEMLATAVEINQQSLLVPGSLPEPGIAGFAFRDRYGVVMSETLPQKILKAGAPPTDAEIRAAQDRLLNEVFKPRIYTVNNHAANETEVMLEYNAAAALVPAQLRKAVTQRSKLYMNPDALTINRGIATQNRPDAMDVWWAQVGLWVQTDVCEAIAAANNDSNAITESVVKHLIKLDVSATQFVGAPPVVAMAPGAAPPVAVDPSAPPPKRIDISSTGRVSNPLYDVVHFTLIVNADAAHLPVLLQELSRNHLMTVRKMDVVALDTAINQSQGFYYGNQPVVQATMQCEALFLREWTRQYMPGRLRRALGITDAPPPTAQ